jgi:hypothetical protein
MDDTPVYRRLIVIAPLVAVIGAGVWLTFLRDRSPPLSPAGAQEKAEAFLEAVRAGRADDAWAGTAADFKSMYGRDRFRQYVRSKPVLKTPATFEGCEFKTNGSLRMAECTFRPAGGKGTITVVLSIDQDSWKVGRLSVGG